MKKASIFRMWALVAALAVAAPACARAASANLAEDWEAGGLSGWDVAADPGVAEATNSAGAFELHFQPLDMPIPLLAVARAGAAASGGWFTGDYLGAGVMNVLFRFYAAGCLPGRVRLQFESAAGRRWSSAVTVPATNEWLDVLVPLDVDAWFYGVGQSRDQFLADLSAVVWIGVSVQRSARSEGEEIYRIDDFVLDGTPLSVAGTVSYSGGRTGSVVVRAATTEAGWETGPVQALGGPGRFYLTSFANTGSYWLKAFLDSNGNGFREASEAWGEYAGNPVNPAGNPAGLDFAVADHDSDGDGLPDWVETDTGTYAGPTDTGTDPNNYDSDGDGLYDGDEVNGATPSDPNLVDSDFDGFTDSEELSAGTDPMDSHDYPSSGIAVTQPGVATLALAGTDLHVTWSAANLPLNAVDVVLGDTGESWTLARNWPADGTDGTLDLFLPLTLPYSTTYRIHVYRSGLVTDYGSSAPFTIRRRSPADFDGDGITDLALYYPTAGMWFLMQSTDAYRKEQFGWTGPTPVPADYDGDGRTDIAVYYPPTGMWYILRSRDGFTTRQFGFSGTRAVAADYDADGVADLGIYHADSGMWYLLTSSSGFLMQQFGWGDALPVPADYDGDGKADIGAFDSATADWYVWGSQDGFSAWNFGRAGAQPVPGDYDGDHVADPATYHAPDGMWDILESSTGQAATKQFGSSTLKPVPGDYDGDGVTDLGVYDPSDGTWYIQKSTDGFSAIVFGWAQAVPVVGGE